MYYSTIISDIIPERIVRKRFILRETCEKPGATGHIAAVSGTLPEKSPQPGGFREKRGTARVFSYEIKYAILLRDAKKRGYRFSEN